MDPNNAWQAYYNRFGGQEQGMVGNPASLLLAHQQLREAANQVDHLKIWEIPEEEKNDAGVLEYGKYGKISHRDIPENMGYMRNI